MSEIRVSYDDIVQVSEQLTNCGKNAENVINRVLQNEAFEPITKSIIELIHPSGRHWKGKAASATSVQPFLQKNGNLYIDIVTKKTYGYLYFPDDGGKSRHHAGKQDFMGRGVMREMDNLTEICLRELKKELE